ncbi:MAG: ATP-dependent DNA helicase [Actinomycetota bacterium]|nr:ATP-dependent DNA helicase [Actinomycetota bacterium]
MSTPNQLDQVLDRAVQIATGKATAGARPSQRALADAILAAMEDGRHTAAESPTGTGKSLAYLVPAALRAALDGERIVISTETLALQSQLQDKDAPAAVQAVSEVLGLVAPTVAVLKGWSNTACSMSAVATASDLTMLPSKDPAKLLEALRPMAGETVDLVRWALERVLEGNDGDKASYDGVIVDEGWRLVSTTPAECPGASTCPFGPTCLPQRAKARAAEADIVITNHSMLAVQAATSAKVVLGSKLLGPFHHLVVDEAHGLASAVRNQGSVSVSPSRIVDALRGVERLLDRPAKAKVLRDDATALAERLDKHLLELLARAAVTRDSRSRSSDQVAKITADENPFDGIDLAIQTWVGRLRRMAPKPLEAHAPKEMVARYRAIARLDSLVADVSQAASGDNGVARWVERSQRLTSPGSSPSAFSGASVRMAPVDVSGMLRANLYEAQAEDHEPEETEVSTGPEDAPDQVEVVTDTLVMSVTVLSATLPASFVVDLGVDARRVEHPSPFEEAYERSWVFIPKAPREALARPGAPRTTFDVERHPDWAAGLICELVGANRGSALVLAATTSAGKLYAERLRRAHRRMTVHSQWDGPPVRRLVEAWRDDHASVLVGTRGLMTGVDAPGATCSLVVVDRCPRAASNPVDDARVDNLCSRLQIDRWAADRMVYVADAALLLEQAAGRLVRSGSDQGMVVVLDPRLLPARLGDFHYPEPTRKAYLAALGRFPHRTSGTDKALAYLQAQSHARSRRRPKVA